MRYKKERSNHTVIHTVIPFVPVAVFVTLSSKQNKQWQRDADGPHLGLSALFTAIFMKKRGKEIKEKTREKRGKKRTKYKKSN